MMYPMSSLDNIRELTNTDDLYSDENCTSKIDKHFGAIQYIKDSYCNYNKDTVFSKWRSLPLGEASLSRICIDGTKYEDFSTDTESRVFFYKPSDESFHTIYRRDSNDRCYEYEKGNIILLKPIDEAGTSFKQALAARRTYCESYCAALKAEAEAAGWAKIKRVQLDVE